MDSGNKKQINVGHSQIYYTGVLPGEDERGRSKEWRVGEHLGEEGEREKVGVFIQKSPSCPTTQAKPSSIKEQGFFQRSQCPSALAWLEKPRE